MVTISIVSHGQADLVHRCLLDLTDFPEVARVIVTLNIPESDLDVPTGLEGRLLTIRNITPLGFGANHNQAFLNCETPFYCVINPDIRLPKNPFPVLVAELGRKHVAAIGPAVLSPSGQLEDSVRKFPTPLSLGMKILCRGDGRYQFAIGDETFAADWIGGMFMLFQAEDYKRVKGFDEGFFLYYEDVDICARLWKAGCRVLACPKAQVVHDARRASHRNLRYMRWHVSSVVRYLSKHWLRFPNTEGR
ncbi:MAG: glycosyltransferase family 2 protein [Thiobacillus sp.]|nr:MAG: glycosyltransferase family 2 protein [Thiobacillus sp.]